MTIKNTTQKVCAPTATIEKVERKNLGNVDIPNYMPKVTVKIVISIDIISKEGTFPKINNKQMTV